MHSFQLTKNIIGIDVGTYSLKVALVQKGGDKVVLLNYGIFRLPKPAGMSQTWSRQEISAFIQHTLKEMGIKTTEAVSEISGPWTVARYLVLSDLVEDEMREAIRWGSKSEFPFALDEAVIDFYKLNVTKNEEGEAEAEIISAVATRQVVEEHFTLLREAGLKSSVISLPSFDLMQTYRISQNPPWKETAALVDLGHKNARLIILKDGKLKFSREFSVAGEVFTQSLVGSYEIDGQTIEIDEVQAEKVKIKSGLLEEWDAYQNMEGLPQEQVQQRLRPVMDRLIFEIERTLNYYKNEFKDDQLQRILLTGGGSLLSGLPHALEQNLEISVQLLNQPPALAFKKKVKRNQFLEDLPFLSSVLGLITQRHPFINLSPTYVLPQEKVVSKRNFLKPVLAGTVLLGVVFGLGVPYWNLTGEIARLQKELAGKKAQMNQLGKSAQEMSRLEQEEALLNKALEGLPKIERGSVPLGQLFQELNRLVPVNMTLTNFQFSKEPTSPSPTEPKGTQAKPPASGTGKVDDIQGISSKEGKGAEYHLVVQGVVFGSDQEIIVTLTDFTEKMNRSDYFKEARVQMTIKSTEFAKAAAEFKVLAKIGIGPNLSGGRLPHSPV